MRASAKQPTNQLDLRSPPARERKKPPAESELTGDALANFDPAVGAWFRSALGAPTDVQARAWPHIARGDTTLLLAPTGSGKTLAAFLAAIDRLGRAPLPEKQARLRVLYVSPLKALAVDVERNLRAPLAGISEAALLAGTSFARLEASVRTGDTPTQERTQMASAPPDILITTPESLFLLLTSRGREMLASVETVILDEIHQMAQSKRGSHLFLSLERLAALRPDRALQRIGLSATQRPLEEIARLLSGFEKGRPRAVSIIDASQKKSLSISVEMPPPLPPAPASPDPPLAALQSKRLHDDDEEEDAPGDEHGRSIWPQVHAQLVARIKRARSTMVFVNSRRLAERLAAALNETAGEELALAHHGSVDKDTRRAIEERLKAGNLRAIVATSSLELGIDMGAVDQVIQVEAPPSVASGIQRIGRASHHVGGVPSGILVPKHKHDLLACAAAAAGIEAGDVEATHYPRNPLDVLAQQIVAIVSVGIGLPKIKSKKRRKKPLIEDVIYTQVDALWELVKSAAPFADLPRASFDGVLDMLAGRYPSDEFFDLRPRITWDRARGVLSPRAGAQRLAIMNAGTIPDRGLYGVFLKDDARTDGDVARGSSKQKPSRRVGELDEEMVFELKEGEVFLLGASSWRTEQITRDRVIVTHAAGAPGKMPFWHGDRAGRTAAFGARIGALTEKIATLKSKDALDLLAREHHLDTRSAESLLHYVTDEKQIAGTVPSDKTIVVERVPDELGDLRICVLSPFGSRVHAPWAMVALASLRAARAGDIEAVWSDDGIVFRVPGGEAPPPVDRLFPAAEDVEEILMRELAGSSLFSARFREAAARALLLPRATIGKRTPLWAQRKRAADLLAVASQYPSFPIVLETYREVLRDAFDLPELTNVLRAIAARKIRVTTIDLHAPSPFAASLLFSFVGNFIYDEDAPVQERRAQALTIDHAQLRDLLGETELRKLLDPEVVRDHARMLQRLDRPLKSADAISDLLRVLGDTREEDVLLRCEDPTLAREWISNLVNDKRALRSRIGGEIRLIAVEDAGRYRDALGVVPERGVADAFLEPTKDALTSIVARHARTHGPFVASDLAERWKIGEASVVLSLEKLIDQGKVTSGAFLPESTTGAIEYCDAEVLRAIKQKTLARLRKAIEPVDGAAFSRFLCDWQNVRAPSEKPSHDSLESLYRALTQLEGCPVVASVLERDILPARVPAYASYMLDQLLASGEIVWAGIDSIGPKDGRIALYFSDREALLSRNVRDDAPKSPLHEAIRSLLERRGAVFFQEIARSVGGFPGDAIAALWDLVWSGEATNDTFEPLRALFRRDEKRGRPQPRVPGRAPRGSEGRWSLRRARWSEVPSETERATAIARSLLERYGVVLREAPGAEGLTGGFANVYDVYRVLEDQGRVRRGYFVAGRGALQFALPGAEERLRVGVIPREKEDATKDDVMILAATDPANPYGALLPWPNAEGRSPQRAPGARVITSRGKLLAWVARGSEHVVTFFAHDDVEANHLEEVLARALVELAKRRKRPSILKWIDGAPAPEHRVARALVAVGFVARQGALVRFRTHDEIDRGAARA